jgi:hypothetical protein
LIQGKKQESRAYTMVPPTVGVKTGISCHKEERGKTRGGVAKVGGRLYKCSGGRQILPGTLQQQLGILLFFPGLVILVSGCDLTEEQGHLLTRGEFSRDLAEKTLSGSVADIFLES